MDIKPSTLYLVGTPIGNLGDLSPRAAEVLEKVDFIAAEDTRVTAKLLRHLGIGHKPMVSYHEHNQRGRGEEIVARLQGGACAALCTDAGMPAISDPGGDLVALCHARGVAVESVPGPSAVTTALALSGLPSGRFCFEGFLPTARGERAARLAELAQEPRTTVLYEAPHRLQRTLADLLGALGDRRVTLCREMTKLHEESVCTTLAEAAARYAQAEPRGEFALVIEGCPQRQEPAGEETLRGMLRGALEEGLTGRDAVRRVTERSGAPKNQVYALYTALAEEGAEGRRPDPENK